MNFHISYLPNFGRIPMPKSSYPGHPAALKPRPWSLLWIQLELKLPDPQTGGHLHPRFQAQRSLTSVNQVLKATHGTLSLLSIPRWVTPWSVRIRRSRGVGILRSMFKVPKTEPDTAAETMDP